MVEAVTYFKALSDETRLRLVNILQEYELNVNEIVEIMAMGQSRVSRHLKILNEAGLVSARKDGIWSFYSVVGEGEGQKFVESIRFLFDAQPVLKSDILKARKVMAERSRKSVSFFDSIAGDWEQMRRDILGGLDLAGAIIKHINGSGIVADLGCGSGGNLLPGLAEISKSAIGVDRSPRMLEEAGKSFDKEGLEIDLRIGELEHLPLRDGEADAVVMNMVLHHLMSPLVCLKEAHRVLKPGGRLIIADFLAHGNERMRTDYHDRWLGFSRREITRWLKQAGFRLGDTENFTLSGDLELSLYISQKRNHLNKKEKS